ncbi:MAG TPA: PKD domain-containing protein, partial [Candidatus Nanoarchaeia archaeon]|nr:PKD domain-containing protein [Candidatus Nanoarchaeia archaeon]
MKKEGVLISGLILIIFFISLISASFTIGNHSITKNYAPDSNITGWVNISLSNQPSSSVLESSLGGSITLIDLLKKTSFSYTCSPLSCNSNYLASNRENSKIFSFDDNPNEKMFGFNISSTGKNLVSEISSFSLELISDNPEIDKFPLAVDILNDGQKEWEAYKSSGDFGSEDRGCYIGVEGSTTRAKIAQTLYCEKIEISQTPEVEIGAYVTHVSGTKNVPFTISIKGADSSEYASCGKTATGSGPNERIACTPSNFHINQDGDYFVCIKATNAPDVNKYEIFYEQDSPCGFTGTYSGTYDYDFEIFARQAKYAPAINFTLNNAELAKAGNPINIESYIKNYVSSMYNNNCSKGCIIPIKIYSGVEQQVSISNALVQYVAGISTETTNLYDVQEAPAQISSTGFQKLYLDSSGFKAPTEPEDYILSVKLGGEELFSEDIKVGAEAVPDIKSLNPTITGVKYPTKFTVEVSSANITKYTWNFGDGSVAQSTTIKEASHTYTTAGSYMLGITISNNQGTNSSKEFNITVAPASQIVPMLLEGLETDLANIKSQIENFSEFEQKSLNEALNLDVVESNLTQMSDAASKATSEGEYEAILGGLLGIKIPQAVAKTVYSEGITFYPETTNLNVEILTKIGGGTYEAGKDSTYQESILAWDVENIDAVLTYSEISLLYEDYEDSSLKVFDFNVANKGSDNPYFIIKEMK